MQIIFILKVHLPNLEIYAMLHFSIDKQYGLLLIISILYAYWIIDSHCKKITFRMRLAVIVTFFL